MVAATDGIVTLATRIAQRFAHTEQLQILPPIELAGFEVVMAWRSVVIHDPAIQWLRGELGNIGSTIGLLVCGLVRLREPYA